MKEDKITRRKGQLIQALWYLLLLFVLFLICKYLLPLLAPFLVGFAIAFILKPLYLFLSKKTHLNEKFCGAVIILLFYGLLVAALWILGSKLVLFIMQFASNAQNYFDAYLAPILSHMNTFSVQTAANLSPELAAQTNAVLSGLSEGLKTCITNLSSKILTNLAQLGMKIPALLVNLAFAVMSSIFISMDYHNVVSFVIRQLPVRFRATAFEIKGYFVGTVCKYLRSYFILMIITFVELSIGLSILKNPNAIAISALTAFCDALPVLGTGIVLIPWAIFCFLQGNFSQGFGILVIYVVVGAIRNFIEPKILGQQLGLHPLATLISIYLGMKAFGLIGMIFFPIVLQIIVSLQKSGSFRFYREKDKQKQALP